MFTSPDSLISIVGATGTIGRALVARAQEAALPVRLIGRNEIALRELADKSGSEWARVETFSADTLFGAVEGSGIVVNLAGAFASTARPVAEAALAAGANYLDISNEYASVAMILDLDERARQRGVTLMPAVGFGTVATEGLAAALADGEPVQRVDVALFPENAGRSRGALGSVLQVLAAGGASIEDGRFRRRPLGRDARRLSGPKGQTTLVAVSIGDLATIPNTLGATFVTGSVGLGLPPFAARVALPLVSVIMRSPRLRARIASRPAKDQPAAGPFQSRSWARVVLSSARARDAWMTTGEGHSFTVDALGAAITRLVAGEAKPGSATAIRAFGPNFQAARSQHPKCIDSGGT